MSARHYEKFEDILRFEKELMRLRWVAKNQRRGIAPLEQGFDPDHIRGLALSGGGIRSAAFCMGVVQQLHVAGVIDRLHYMSTVSGGGYTGASLSWFLAKDCELPGGPRFGTTRENFPFIGGEPVGIRNARTDPRLLKLGPIDGRQVLDYIRQRSSYLNPGAGLSIISAVAIVLRSLIVSLVGYVLLAALIFKGVENWGEKVATSVESGAWFPWSFAGFPWGLKLLYAIPVAAAGIILFLSLLYSILAPLPLTERANYIARRFYQPVAGFVLSIGLGSLALALLMELIHLFTTGVDIGNRAQLANLPLLGALAAAAGAVGGLVLQAVKQAGTRLMLRIAMVLLPPISLLLLAAGIGALGYTLAAYVGDRWLWLLVATAAFCLYANINLTGLHRFYRDRLMEAFLPDLDDIREDSRASRTKADARHLADICRIEDDGPYHLINAHVVLKSGSQARFRSRRGDSFVLSPRFCGSEATGYIATSDWLPSRGLWPPARPVGPLRLSTAMAISGAAANPHTGADGQGVTKGPFVSAIMTLLNIRLGYWVPSPRPGRFGWRRRSYFWPPNFLFPGVKQGLLGLGHHEYANWLELTDGGHFENTGIYELVRRGVRTIVFADGSTDPDVALSSFANVLEKIYIDFGVTVDFDQGAHFTDLMKGTAEPWDVVAEKMQSSKAGFAIATIRYPEVVGRPAYEGRLFYVKSTMVRDLPTALYSYKATNPLFPAESLADQFFSEQQFEAYRALGYALTKAMMAHVAEDWTKQAGTRSKTRQARLKKGELALADYLDLKMARP